MAARGIFYGLLFSLPLWAAILALGSVLSGCAKPDDGAGNLWRAVKYVQERR